MVEQSKTQKGVCAYEGGKFQIEDIAIPTPGKGQVLVKVECAPINPSDTYFLRGLYNIFGDAQVNYPLVGGWEGAGTVIASGGGFMAWRLQGKRVSITKCAEKNNSFTIGGCYQ